MVLKLSCFHLYNRRLLCIIYILLPIQIGIGNGMDCAFLSHLVLCSICCHHNCKNAVHKCIAVPLIPSDNLQPTNILLYLDIVFLSLSVVHSIISMLEQWPALFTTKHLAVLCSCDFFLLQNLCTILTYILIQRAYLMRSLLQYGMLSQNASHQAATKIRRQLIRFLVFSWVGIKYLLNPIFIF